MPTRSIRRVLIFAPAALYFTALALPVIAQDELTLTVRREFGYGNGSQIQGRFTMEAASPANLTSVTFMVDDAAIGTVNAPPFKIQFTTNNYPAGWHTLTAVGRTSDGRTITSAPRQFEFVTTEQAWAATGRIIVGILGVVGTLMLIGFAAQLITLRSSKRERLRLGAPRSYGLLGGAICPKCKRPFAVHGWSLNIGFRKFDRCDHCGQWSLVSQASPQQLVEAESAELSFAQPQTPIRDMSAEEKLKKQLDESRFVEDC